MSKKNREQALGGGTAYAGHAAEHQIIKHDLVRVIILNVVYLAAILTLYYTNHQRHFLDHWLTKYINF